MPEGLVINILRELPAHNGAIIEAEIIFLAGVFHKYVSRLLNSPGTDIHPVLGVGLRIMNGNRMHDRVGIRPKECAREYGVLAVRMTGGIQPGIPVEILCYDDERIALPMPHR